MLCLTRKMGCCRGLALMVFLWPALGSAQAPNDPFAFWERAALYRDEWGAPHVYASSFRALAFVFGYAQAEDHLEPMLVAYRVANGRAAAIFGETYAASDEFALKMGHAVLAATALPELDPLSQDLCEGFAIGVNAWMVEHPDRVPPWADGVKPEDILALMHCYLMSMAPFDLPDTFHREPASFSGNAWAVGPARSESGQAILAINPHAFYAGPFLWYEAHLACQDMNVAGATLFGLPVILMGHNETLGWALTPNQPDFADVYLESPRTVRRDPKSVMGSREFSDDDALRMLLLEHTQRYYVNTPAGPVARTVPCMATRRGAIVGHFAGEMCAYKIGGHRDFGALFQLVEMARARDLARFKAALGNHQLPCFHIVYADRAGNIFYLYNTKVGDKAVAKELSEPIVEEDELRGPPLINWRVPLPAGNPLFVWGPVVPMEDLPAVLNPKSGYVQACGAPPWGVTDGLAMRPDDFPPWLVADRDTFRAHRVRQLLSIGKRSFRDCQSMLYDMVVPFAIEAVPALMAAAAEKTDFVANAHPDLSLGLDVLGSWDYVAETGSAGMTFFHAWWSAFQAAAAPMFTSELEVLDALHGNGPNIQPLALDAAAAAARMMRNEFDSLTVPWGDVHVLRRGDREVPMPGAASGQPIFTASDYVYEQRKWRVTYGYGFAMVVEFGERPSAVSIVPFGASEDPESPHYADQLDLMVGRRFKVTRFEHEDVQRYATRARGRILYLRPPGVEAVFTLSAAAPIEARLHVTTEPPTNLPEGLTAFTVFVETEKAPLATAMNTHIAVYIPGVLCAQEDLPDLAVYAYDPLNEWFPLEPQELNEANRTLTAQDGRGPRVYAVLGPAQLRAGQTIPGEDKAEDKPQAPTLPKPSKERAKAVTIPKPHPPSGPDSTTKPSERQSQPSSLATEEPTEDTARPEQQSKP